MRRYVKWVAPMLLGAALSAPIPAVAATDVQLCTANQVKALGKTVNVLIKRIVRACNQGTFGVDGVSDISHHNAAKDAGWFHKRTLLATDNFGRDTATGVPDGDCPIADPASFAALTPNLLFTLEALIFSVVCP